VLPAGDVDVSRPTGAFFVLSGYLFTTRLVQEHR
jgi:peptidoglycan/LPS O-acetylase OafA/YrhL